MAQTAADSSAIVATALDYIEGYYTGDGERMERALHPDLAKRIVMTNPTTGESLLQDMTAEQLVGATRMGYGKQVPESDRRMDVTILDIYENAASVKIMAHEWIDYLHIAKYEGNWVIVNVLWELTPEAKQKMSGGD
jgi:hypothetical protein